MDLNFKGCAGLGCECRYIDNDTSMQKIEGSVAPLVERYQRGTVEIVFLKDKISAEIQICAPGFRPAVWRSR